VFKRLALGIEHLSARLSWHALGTPRALTAAALIGVIVFGTLHVLQPPPPDTSRVIVAAEDLSAGTVLAATDLRIVDVDPAIIPETGFDDIDEAVGKTLATPVPAGLFLTASALMGPGLYSSVPAGTVATPVRFSDPELIQLLHPGDRINVLVTHHNQTESDTAEVVTRRALVLATPEPEENASGLLGSSPANSGSIVLLAVPESESAALAAASQMGALSIALVE